MVLALIDKNSRRGAAPTRQGACPFSKWVFSNMFQFLTIEEALVCRQASTRLNEACLIGFNIGMQDLQAEIDRLLVAISLKFSQDDQEKHKDLRSSEVRIN